MSIYPNAICMFYLSFFSECIVENDEWCGSMSSLFIDCDGRRRVIFDAILLKFYWYTCYHYVSFSQLYVMCKESLSCCYTILYILSTAMCITHIFSILFKVPFSFSLLSLSIDLVLFFFLLFCVFERASFFLSLLLLNIAFDGSILNDMKIDLCLY